MKQLQICKWLLLAALLMIGSEGAPESNPWITPIPNLDAAMEGFDPIMSNPLERPDPGIRNQIFEPMRELPDGRVVVNSFIDKAREDLHCDAELSCKTLRNYNEYNREKSSCHQFSLNADVSVKAGFWRFSFSASAGYGRESTGEERSVQKLFRETNGEIVESKAECITHSVSISLFERPVFTAAFKTALRQLHFASKTPDSESSRRVYVKFVLSYGTHFMKTTYLGSKLIFEKRFTSKAVDSSEQSARSECVTNSAYASLGAKVMTVNVATSFEMSSKGCESADESKSFFQSNGFSSEKVISIGSLPHGDLEQWSNTVKESPVPIYYELEKISSLFQSEWFNTITTDDSDPNEEKLNGTAMYDFFEDNSAFFCQLILGEACEVEKKGCGYNSLCRKDETCVSDQKSDLGYTCNSMKNYDGAVISGGNNNVNYYQGMLSTSESFNFYDLPSLPSRVQSNTLTSVGTVLYSCGGRVYVSSGAYTSQNICYYLDTASSSPNWYTWYALPVAMSRHTAVNVGKDIWFVVWEKLHSLNVARKTIRTYSLPFTVSYAHCAVSNATHSYVIGVGLSTREIWVNTIPSSPTQWRFVQYLPIGLDHHACLWFGSDVIITGGNPFRTSSYLLDTLTHKLIQTGSLSSGRNGHQMMAIDGKPGVVGGWGGGQKFLTSIEIYDTKSKNWSTHSRQLKQAREYFGLAQVSG